jgi:hypothetical protein
LEAAVSELTGNEYRVQDDDEVVYERADPAQDAESPVSPRREPSEIRQYSLVVTHNASTGQEETL